jgi:hypothetical protein
MIEESKFYEALLNSIDNLKIFLLQEEDHVRQHNFTVIHENLPKKNDLCENFQHYLDAFTKSDSRIELGEEDKKYLKNKVEDLRLTMQQNKRALDLAKCFNDKLIKMCLIGQNDIKIKHYDNTGIFNEEDVMRVVTYTSEI